jgi:pimeloyl-ACP methyl ester carboxylesterase
MIEIRVVGAGGMAFRTRFDGDHGEQVLLLHGFPETSHMWTDLMPRLAAEGYRCIAPDQRGYSPGARPDAVDAYDYTKIADDVFAIADACGVGRFHLVGHDVGALVGWAAVHRDAAERIASFTSMSIPHALAFARDSLENPAQALYQNILGLILAEGTLENAVTQNDGAQWRSTYTASPPEQIDEYIGVLSQPGAMRAAANWYRHTRGHKAWLEPDAPFGDVTHPTLLIWGKNDPYVGRGSVEKASPYMKGEYRVVELEAGHWLAQEAPDAVASEVLAHLRAHTIT